MPDTTSTLANTSTTNNDNGALFNADIFKELRERAILCLKLDLAYLAAAGAILAALKFSNDELMELPSQLWILVIVYTVLVFHDVFVEESLLKRWIAAKAGKSVSIEDKLIKYITNAQATLHAAFIVLILSGALGASMAHVNYKKSYQARAKIEDAVELFVRQHKYVPSSIQHVIAKYSFADYWHKKIDSEPIFIESLGNNQFRIVFAGNDKELGTNDDIISAPNTRVRPIYERMFGMKAQERKANESRSSEK